MLYYHQISYILTSNYKKNLTPWNTARKLDIFLCSDFLNQFLYFFLFRNVVETLSLFRNLKADPTIMWKGLMYAHIQMGWDVY